MSGSVYLLRGDPFLAEEALQRLRAELQADPLAEVQLDRDADVAALVTAVDTPSLLGGRRLVVLRDAQDLTKDQAELVGRYLAAPSPHATLVLLATGRSRIEDSAKKAGAKVVALEAPRGRALVSWVRERAGAAGFTLDDRGAWALIDAVGTELRDLDASLQQLATALGPGGRAGPAEVRRMFPRLADERMFVLTDAVGDRKLDTAMAALRRLLGQGDHPLVLLGALSSHLRRMLRARRFLERGPRTAADALGLPEWRAERLLRQARSYRDEEIVAALEVLADTDVGLKGGLPPEAAEAALESAVVRIVS